MHGTLGAVRPMIGTHLAWQGSEAAVTRLGGVLKKAIRESEWLFSVKSAFGGSNPPAVGEIAAR